MVKPKPILLAWPAWQYAQTHLVRSWFCSSSPKSQQHLYSLTSGIFPSFSTLIHLELQMDDERSHNFLHFDYKEGTWGSFKSWSHSCASHMLFWLRNGRGGCGWNWVPSLSSLKDSAQPLFLLWIPRPALLKVLFLWHPFSLNSCKLLLSQTVFFNFYKPNDRGL